MVTRWHPKKGFFKTPSNETCTANGLTFTANDQNSVIPTNNMLGKMISQFVNDLRTSALRKETKKPSGCGLTEPFILYSPNKKHLDIGLKLLCARRAHVVAVLLLLFWLFAAVAFCGCRFCCCCCSFLVLLSPVWQPSSTIIHITQSWEPKFHDHGDTDRLTLDSQQKHV